ncbi:MULTISPECIES: redoxin domain-containing protein [unclassified Mycoplasma]|uniref:redoxin domain-containing protein n=1 Tax=unclassified Mycoplasma TaxID=2683645 RepID=UPI00211C2CEF|nr:MULTISPECIES: redoxin domain-containing protein [unclassified Mycoplasma]UUM19018.1 redoxin domain-containing protein [Mycoplasma sp. 1018B]WRQ25727.1 redoxin domain-containing protein [Mycoplasma sp. 888]
MRTITMGGKTLHLQGNEVELGQQLKLVGAKAGTFAQAEAERTHKYAVLTVFPSINTSVCDLQILELGKISEKHPNFDYISFSVDLPTALIDYKNMHPTGNVEMYSDYYNKEVSNQLGLLIDELHINARAIFILDENNKVLYKQINSEVKDQVDFELFTKELIKYE